MFYIWICKYVLFQIHTFYIWIYVYLSFNVTYMYVYIYIWMTSNHTLSPCKSQDKISFPIQIWPRPLRNFSCIFHTNKKSRVEHRRRFQCWEEEEKTSLWNQKVTTMSSLSDFCMSVCPSVCPSTFIYHLQQQIVWWTKPLLLKLPLTQSLLAFVSSSAGVLLLLFFFVSHIAKNRIQ